MTGKTSFVDVSYVLNPYDWWLKNKEKQNCIKPYWVYNSMERNMKYKIAKWTCLKLFKDHNIIMDVPTMLGWSGKRYELDEEVKKKLFESGKYFDQMFENKVIEIHDGAQNPTGIFNRLIDIGKQNGEMQQIDQYTRKYVPNDPNSIVIVINDHVGKLKGERNFNDKQLLDKHTEFMGGIRDRYGFFIVDISQFNRSIGSVDRMKIKDVSPEPDDFKGSSDMYENCDLALGLFNPYKFKINDFLGYDIPKFVSSNGENRFRSVSIIKNSYGADDIIIGLNFLGENGNFRQMPIPEKFIERPSLYDKARNFN